MDNYDFFETVGEGTYGKVFKARVKANGRIVAIKKFKESDEEEQVKKTALREIRILKQLKHDNIVSLLEVFRNNGKNYLVFEYVERTILEELEAHGGHGLDKIDVKKTFFQLLQALKFIHDNNIIHRDIKPENLLMSKNGVLKLCDFGFARVLTKTGSKYTDYVATRWYRSPELLVGDTAYGKGVDVWAAGCMFAEIATGQPLFPGDSDLDQIHHIMRSCGELTPEHKEIFSQNPYYTGAKFPMARRSDPLPDRFPESVLEPEALQILEMCLVCDPALRSTVNDLLAAPYFAGFAEWFAQEHRDATARDREEWEGKKVSHSKKGKESKEKATSSEHKHGAPNNAAPAPVTVPAPAPAPAPAVSVPAPVGLPAPALIAPPLLETHTPLPEAVDTALASKAPPLATRDSDLDELDLSSSAPPLLTTMELPADTSTADNSGRSSLTSVGGSLGGGPLALPMLAADVSSSHVNVKPPKHAKHAVPIPAVPSPPAEKHAAASGNNATSGSNPAVATSSNATSDRTNHAHNQSHSHAHSQAAQAHHDNSSAADPFDVYGGGAASHAPSVSDSYDKSATSVSLPQAHRDAPAQGHDRQAPVALHPQVLAHPMMVTGLGGDTSLRHQYTGSQSVSSPLESTLARASTQFVDSSFYPQIRKKDAAGAAKYHLMKPTSNDWGALPPSSHGAQTLSNALPGGAIGNSSGTSGSSGVAPLGLPMLTKLDDKGAIVGAMASVSLPRKRTRTRAPGKLHTSTMTPQNQMAQYSNKRGESNPSVSVMSLGLALNGSGQSGPAYSSGANNMSGNGKSLGAFAPSQQLPSFSSGSNWPRISSPDQANSSLHTFLGKRGANGKRHE